MRVVTGNMRCKLIGQAHVPDAGGSSQRLLCVAARTPFPTGAGGSAANQAHQDSLGGKWRGLRIPIARQAIAQQSAERGKLLDDLCGLGCDISPNRAWRLARLAGIRARIGYKKKPGSYGGNPAVVARNTLNREFDGDAPDQFRGEPLCAIGSGTMASDITYIRTHEGFLYLAVVIDLFSRRVSGPFSRFAGKPLPGSGARFAGHQLCVARVPRTAQSGPRHAPSWQPLGSSLCAPLGQAQWRDPSRKASSTCSNANASGAGNTKPAKKRAAMCSPPGHTSYTPPGSGLHRVLLQPVAQIR